MSSNKWEKESTRSGTTCYTLAGKGKVHTTYSSVYPYQAYNSDSTKSKRFKELEAAKRAVENNNFD